MAITEEARALAELLLDAGREPMAVLSAMHSYEDREAALGVVERLGNSSGP